MASSAVKIPFTEAAAPATPATGEVVVYAKTDGLLYQKDDAGTETLLAGGGAGAVATDAIWDAAGDLVQGTGANTAAKLALGAAGTVVRSTGSANAYAYPPGYELDYVEITTGVTITGTAFASETTIVTGTSQAYTAEPIFVHFFSPGVDFDATAAGEALIILLYDGSTAIGRLDTIIADTTATARKASSGHYRFTPTADTHQYIVKAYKASGSTAAVGAGAAGGNVNVPAFLRITKV
jgi:hypothetical protein